MAYGSESGSEWIEHRQEQICAHYSYVGHGTGEHLKHVHYPICTPSANASPRPLTLSLVVNS